MEAAALGLPASFVGQATLLGTGGFGEVWLCCRLKDGAVEQVAVKITKRALVDCTDEQLERLRREAINQGVLASLHVAQLHDVGCTQHVPPVSADNDGRVRIYLVLEYAEGMALTNHIPFSEGSARWNFLQLLFGLRHCHAQNIYIRDIKPDNCLIAGGLLKVADFGLSKCLEEDGALGTVVGTPVYMAPEVYDMSLRDEQGHYDGGKVDVYSCGATLFQMVFGRGRLPFWFHASDGRSLDLGLAADRLALAQNKAASRWWPPHENWPADPILRDLLDGMLQADPRRRLSLTQVIAHPWCARNVQANLIRELKKEPVLDARHEEFKAAFRADMEWKFGVIMDTRAALLAA